MEAPPWDLKAALGPDPTLPLAARLDADAVALGLTHAARPDGLKALRSYPAAAPLVERLLQPPQPKHWCGCREGSPASTRRSAHRGRAPGQRRRPPAAAQRRSLAADLPGCSARGGHRRADAARAHAAGVGSLAHRAGETRRGPAQTHGHESGRQARHSL